MPVNPELVGRDFPATTPYLVGREKVREFARAVFADDPQHTDPAAAQALGHRERLQDRGDVRTGVRAVGRLAAKRAVRREADVAVGDLAYWPPGSALCIFWGATPASRGAEPRAASPVNVFGQVDDDATAFGNVKSGTLVRVEALEST